MFNAQTVKIDIRMNINFVFNNTNKQFLMFFMVVYKVKSFYTAQALNIYFQYTYSEKSNKYEINQILTTSKQLNH